jgi:ubiquinone biosynthesis protein
LNPIHFSANAARATKIFAVLARNGFLEFLEQIEAPSSWLSRLIPSRSARLNVWQRIRVTAEELGPVFVKFAQIVSTRADVLPEPLIEELKRLRDQVRPVPWEQMRPVLERELKGPIEEIFAEFDREPVAAGSIAQIYRARLRTGEAVALKVQRPGLRKEIKADLEILHWFALKMQEHLPELSAYDLPTVVNEAGENMLRELDFDIEARNTNHFNATNPYPTEIFSPKVYEKHSTKRLLVLEWIDGASPGAVQLAPAEGARLAHIGGRSIFHQIMLAGFFHADPHSGNLFITSDGRLCLIDWGLAGQLTRHMRYFLADVFDGIAHQDSEKVVRVVLANALTKHRVDPVRLENEISIMLLKYPRFDAASGAFGRVMLELLYIFGSNGIRLARDYSLLAKSVIAIEEVGKTLDPGFDIRSAAEPFLKELSLERWSPKTLASLFYWDVRTALRNARDIPGSVARLMRNLEEGEFSINFVHRGLDEVRESFEHGVNRLVLAIIIAATLLSSSLIISRATEDSTGSFLYTLGKFGFTAALLLGFWLLYEIIRHGGKKK